MNYLGDFAASASVYFKLTTSNSAGAAVAPSTAFEAADLVIYKDGSATQRTSSAGVTMTSPFDSITGLHHITIDLSDNTDAGFYAAGHDYCVVLSPDTETVDSQTVVSVVASFSIENRNIKADVTKLLGTPWLTPAVAGTPDVNAKQVAGSATAATNLKNEMLGLIVDAVSDTSPTATSFKGSSALSSTDNFYSTPGTVLAFTSGALIGKAAKVTGYTGATRLFTFASGFPSAPANGDSFILLGLAQ